MTESGSIKAWRDAEHILCVRLDALGDVLMTSPALRAMRASAGGRRIVLLTSPAGAEAARLIPEIDDIIVYEAPWMKATGARRGSGPDWEMARRLQSCGFDGAVIFTVYSQNPLPAALLCYLADIPLRLGYCRENPYQLLTHWVPEVEPETCLRHEVRRQLDLVAAIGARIEDEHLRIEIPLRARATVDRLVAALIPEERPWVVVHPGATAASRRYPAEQFAAAAGRLVQDLGCEVVFTGTESERDLIEQIRQGMDAPSHSTAGALDVAELAALLARAPLLISNNTGTVHVAAAVGTPVVNLYALTNPQHRPWQVPHRVLFHDVSCKYCYKSVCPEGHHHCLRLVPPEAVVEAAEALLVETAVLKKGGLRLVHPGY
jgi:lipopolysaccharide heptosyltransferase II